MGYVAAWNNDFSGRTKLAYKLSLFNYILQYFKVKVFLIVLFFNQINDFSEHNWRSWLQVS